jgi:sensor histidine kinase YesM
VESVYSRISFWDAIDRYTFTPDAAIAVLIQTSLLYLILLFFLRRWQKLEFLNTKELIKIGVISIFLYLVLLKVIGLLISFGFDTIERNFNKETFLLSMLMDFLGAFIYGSFFLTYYYFNKSKNYQTQLVNYSEALSESKIHQLKSQMNPHFLFNNLNILDQLIDEDKHKASDFLNEFSEIYRYVLRASDQKLIAISEELDFAKRYFKLIEYKYGKSYQLEIKANALHGFIPPMTLQLLIENVVKHNLGTGEEPIVISINFLQKIVVSNNINKKNTSLPTSGKALNNLKEQYKLLSDQSIEIKESNNLFIVEIPIIKSSQI